MRDGVFIAKLGVPVVALVTEEFVDQAKFVAEATGMPAVPRFVLPHPCSGTGEANLERVARESVEGIVALLAGRA